jgi:outer membrane lipoprotein-sorting protein
MMKRLLFLFLIILSTVSALAQETANARQAKRVFNTAWNHIYGKEGVRFHYKIDILHLYKEEGTSWNKGDKAKSEYKDSKMWNNGDVKYILREKKGIVEIHDPKVNKKNDKLQMFKFEPDSYNYSIAKDPDGLQVTLEAKPGAKVKMKKIIALLTPGNYYPKKLRIKVSIFWATISFSDFQAGNIDDSIFEFPKEKYSNYKIVDER